MHSMCCRNVFDSVQRVCVHRLQRRLDHGHWPKLRSSSVLSLCCGQVFDSFERDSMHRLQRWLNHEHGREYWSDKLLAMRGRPILDNRRCGDMY